MFTVMFYKYLKKKKNTCTNREKSTQRTVHKGAAMMWFVKWRQNVFFLGLKATLEPRSIATDTFWC